MPPGGSIGQLRERFQDSRFIVARGVDEEIDVHGPSVVPGRRHGEPAYHDIPGAPLIQVAAEFSEIGDGGFS